MLYREYKILCIILHINYLFNNHLVVILRDVQVSRVVTAVLENCFIGLYLRDRRGIKSAHGRLSFLSLERRFTVTMIKNKIKKGPAEQSLTQW